MLMDSFHQEISGWRLSSRRQPAPGAYFARSAEQTSARLCNMLRPWLVAVAGLLALVPRTQAQSRWQNLQANVNNSMADAWDVWTSPLRGTSKDWLGAAGAIGVSAAISPFDDDVDRWAVNHRDDRALEFLHPLRPGGWAFSGSKITPVAV